MSHTLNLETRIECIEALRKAAQRIGATILGGTEHRLFTSWQKGIGVKLGEWKYPVVVCEDGTVFYDNYQGKWGDIAELHRLIDYYGLEYAKAEAEAMGHYCYESTDQLGFPQLNISIQEV